MAYEHLFELFRDPEMAKKATPAIWNNMGTLGTLGLLVVMFDTLFWTLSLA